MLAHLNSPSDMHRKSSRAVHIASTTTGMLVQSLDPINSLALRLFLPLAAAAVAAVALPQRYIDAVAIAALCAIGPLSEQVRAEVNKSPASPFSFPHSCNSDSVSSTFA